MFRPFMSFMQNIMGKQISRIENIFSRVNMKNECILEKSIASKGFLDNNDIPNINIKNLSYFGKKHYSEYSIDKQNFINGTKYDDFMKTLHNDKIKIQLYEGDVHTYMTTCINSPKDQVINICGYYIGINMANLLLKYDSAYLFFSSSIIPVSILVIISSIQLLYIKYVKTNDVKNGLVMFMKYYEDK